MFDEVAVLQRWVDVLSALARAQAELGIVPSEAAEGIATLRAQSLDLDRIAEGTRATGHSTLGFIHELERVLPQNVAPWIYYGITVQDLTDTSMAIALREVTAVLRRDLEGIRAEAVRLAVRHRDTVMIGRTHGQPGAPITFGWKAATWADEVDRHLVRLHEGAHRWTTGQLGGAVGTLGFFGDLGPHLRARFCELLGLEDPEISWLASRDRVAEVGSVFAMVAATVGRIGNEVYQLQRPEIGELREPAAPGTVGSITMPHKRNPEVAEHLVTLARLARASAGTLLEGMVGEHERDARSWKAEWIAVPEVCLLGGTAAARCSQMLAALEVDTEAMARAVETTQGGAASQRVLALLAPRLGKHTAQDLLQRVLETSPSGMSVREALTTHPEIIKHLEPDAISALHGRVDTGSAGAMVDRVVEKIPGHRSDPGVYP